MKNDALTYVGDAYTYVEELQTKSSKLEKLSTDLRRDLWEVLHKYEVAMEGFEESNTDYEGMGNPEDYPWFDELNTQEADEVYDAWDDLSKAIYDYEDWKDYMDDVLYELRKYD